MPRRLLSLALLAAASSVVACSSGPEPYDVRIDVAEDVRALGSDDLFVSEPARERLEAIGPPTRPALLAALAREASPTRVAAIELLVRLPGTVDDPAAVSRLAAMASEDEAAPVRAAAVQAVATLGGAAAPPVVEAALEDRDAAVRLVAAGACARSCESEEAVARLVDLALAPESLPVAFEARRALRHRILERSDGSVATLVGVRARARLRRAPTSDDERERALAALLLAEVDDPSAREVLERTAAASPTPGLRVHAVHALGRLGVAARSDESVPALTRLLRDPTVAYYACDALRRLARAGVAAAEKPLAGHGGACPAEPLPAP